jgi:hypothetical protein
MRGKPTTNGHVHLNGGAHNVSLRMIPPSSANINLEPIRERQVSFMVGSERKEQIGLGHLPNEFDLDAENYFLDLQGNYIHDSNGNKMRLSQQDFQYLIEKGILQVDASSNDSQDGEDLNTSSSLSELAHWEALNHHNNSNSVSKRSCLPL